MAAIDYGAIVKKDGVFINKNSDLFTKFSDTGYICEKAIDKNGEERYIDGNYFVYVGDEDCLLAFYKGHWVMISHNEIVLENWYGTPFISESYFPVRDGLPTVTISHLDPTLYEDRGFWFFETPWENYIKCHYCKATGNEKLNELHKGYETHRWYQRVLKKGAWNDRNHKWPKGRTYRFSAKWEWKGHEYEVIFGYGIDPDEEIWNEIRIKDESENFSYGFTKTEKDILDAWFNKEEK